MATLDKSTLEKYFYYDETSKTCLRWKVDRYSNKKKNKSAGDEAGCAVKTVDGNKSQYRVSLNSKGIGVHRIIWILFNGEIPDKMVVDHLNGDPYDNKINNLKLKTIKHNSQNKKLHTKNITGVAGVTLFKTRKYEYVQSTVIVNGVTTRKFYSILKLGYDLALKKAIEWRENEIQKLNSSPEDYFDRSTI